MFNNINILVPPLIVIKYYYRFLTNFLIARGGGERKQAADGRAMFGSENEL